MRNYSFLRAFVLVLPLFIGWDGMAQEDTTNLDLTALSLEQLQDIKIISANKTLTEMSQVPSTVVVITEEQIRVRGYRSLLDVLLDVPDVKIDDKTYSSSRNGVTVRGVDGQNKFIIMLDGRRISSPTNEIIPIMENYPVHLARQIEIIFGPASALYGADALTGIINIISKETHYNSRTEVSLTTGDHTMIGGTGFMSRKFNKDLVLTLSAQYAYDGGVDMDEHFGADTLWNMTSHKTGVFNTIYGEMVAKEPVRNRFESPLKAYNVFAALKSGDFDITFFKNYAQNSSSLENNPSNAVYNKDVFYGRGVTLISGRYTKQVGRFTLTTSGTASNYKLNPESNYRNMFSGMARAYKYGYGSVISGEQQVEWKPSENTSVVGGFLYESFLGMPESTDLQEAMDESRSIEGTMLNTPDYYRPEGLPAKIYIIKYSNAGGYAQLHQKFGNVISLTAGARFDRNSRFGSTFNPRMGVTLNPLPKTRIKASYATAYLAPTPGTTYAYYGTFHTLDSGKTYRSNYFHLPNPKLKPMESENAEMSVTQYVGKQLSFTATGYYTVMTNLFGVGSDAAVTQLYDGKFMGWDVDYIEVFINGGREETYGGSLLAAYNRSFRHGYLNVYAGLSYVDGEETPIDGSQGAKVEIDVISPWMLKAGIDFKAGKFFVSPRLVSMGAQRVSGLRSDTGDRQTIAGYTLLNMSLGYDFGNLSLHTNITNLLNQTYRAVGPNMNLENTNTDLFYGNYQDPIRANITVRMDF